MGSRNNKPGRIVKGTALQPSLKSASGVWSLDEAMQAHRANAWPQPNLFQPVGNSLRNSLGKTGYISRESPGRSGSQRKFTFSWWLKKNSNATSSQQHLFYSYDGSRLLQIFFETGGNTNPDCICVYGGGTDLRFTPVLRDVSAWYNIVIAVDIDQSTSANTIKCWINGIQITAVGTQGGSPGTPSYPTSATNWPINQAGVYQRIGGNAGGGTMDGQFAEINFIDGAQLQPTLFGQFDTNNTWVPIAYTGSYGTNGFYLPFTNATTSQTLGYDASLTGTATYDVDQDPYRGHVALHLTGNGPAGGNNNVFADSSSTNNAISRTGNITQGSFSPYPLPTNAPYNPAINGASAYFPKSGWLSAPTAAVSSLGTGDFTFESWVYPLDFTTTSLFQRWFSFGTGLASDVTVNIDTSGNLVFRINDATQLTSATSLTANAWNHVAFVRSSGTVRFYINGVSGNSASVATNITTQGGNPIIIGAEPGQSQGSAGDFFGYMSNFRIIKGVAVYTANFTPTNRPFGSLTNNLLTFSEDFVSNGGWGAANITIQPNATIAPDGTPSGTGLLSSNNDPYLTQTISVTNGVTYTASIYVKGSANTIGKTGFLWWWIAGTATGANTFSPYFVYTKDWQRISVSFTPTGSGTVVLRLEPGDGAQTPPAAAGDISYIWGAQVEVGSSASNYVPTPANFSTAPSLLLNFANAAVVDTTGANNLLTVSNATITSASKYGSGALTFNGTSDYLNGRYIPPIGTGDFTVETWCRLPNVTPTSCWRAMITLGAYSASGGLSLFAPRESAPANTAVAILNTVNPTIAGSTNINDNQWHHVALVRNRTRLSLYVDGREEGTTSNNDNITQTILYIGADPGCGSGGIGGAGQTYYQGALEDIRITVGVARYTLAFAPSARALPEIGGKSFVTTNVNAGVVQRFTTTGTTAWTAPSDVTQVEVLVVAAGGTGASDGATNVGNGGGGGGGLIYNSAYPVTPGQTYTVTVGAGQVGLSTAQNKSGGNSVFGNLVAIGGGGGGYYSNGAGSTGGSGGGGGAASGAAGAGTSGQGFAGGAGASNNGGGGGGAGGPASGTNSRDGGLGLQFGISGTPTFYAGGGGGSASSGAQGTGGSGSGGAAVSGGAGGVDGTANTGGGGGAQLASGTKGGNGGSGVVIVRYTTAAVGNTSDATSDNLVDSPTQYGHDTGAGGEVVGNYATFNPIYAQSATITLSNGNLTASNPSTWVRAMGTIAVNTGKWYFESTPSAGNWHMTGVEQPIYSTTHIGGSATKGIALVYDPSNTRGDISYNGGNSVYTGGSVTFNAGDVIGVALDLDNNNVKLYKNNVLQYNLSNLLQAGAYYTFGVSLYSGGTISGNFGQRAWAYTPPAGFSALTTKNLPHLAIGSAAATPNQYFDTVLYTGTGASQTITMPGGFTPDFVWIKRRNSTNSNLLADIVRGNTKVLLSNDTGAELTDASYTTFVSGGFSVSGNGNEINNSSAPYVAWCWRAGGAAVANTAGAITSQVSANTASGFSVVTYTGTGTQASVGHGLSAAPELIITKARNQTNGWYTYTTVIDGSMDYFFLNTNAAKGDSGLAVPTSTVFYNDGWAATHNMVAYCFHSVAGYSKIGTYVGNGSANGPFIYTGFKPRWIMVKEAVGTNAASGSWQIFDTARDLGNPSDNRLKANNADAEAGNAPSWDVVSNGFKLRSTNTNWNDTSGVHLYIAFADKPFGNVNGTAR